NREKVVREGLRNRILRLKRKLWQGAKSAAAVGSRILALELLHVKLLWRQQASSVLLKSRPLVPLICRVAAPFPHAQEHFLQGFSHQSPSAPAIHCVAT